MADDDAQPLFDPGHQQHFADEVSPNSSPPQKAANDDAITPTPQSATLPPIPTTFVTEPTPMADSTFKPGRIGNGNPFGTAVSKRQKKIAVLTSGGDSAGMNAAVRAIVRQGIARGCATYIIREGWEGLVRGNTSDPTPASSRRPSAQSSPASRGGLQGMSAVPNLDLGRAAATVHWAENGHETEAAHIDAELHYHHPADIAPLLDQPLSFGYGGLLRDGAGEGMFEDEKQEEAPEESAAAAGRSLRGKYIVRVGWDDVRGWLGDGGTVIGSSRCPSFRTREGRMKAAHNLIKTGIDCLAICGGDGSLTGADVLRAEWPSLLQELYDTHQIDREQYDAYQYLNIVGLVGSIDNDMSMTDLTIGAVTALHRICESVDSISSTASSHSRAFVIEVMGRHCGWLALMSGVATGADYIFIPESPPPEADWESAMCAKLQSHRALGKRKSIVIVAEGAIDKNCNPIKSDYVKEILTDRLGLDTRVTTLGHTQRGGVPAAEDRVLPTIQGVKALDTLLEATPESPSYMIGIHENKIIRVPLLDAVAKTKEVAKAIEAKDFPLAMSYRDSEFRDMWDAFLIGSSAQGSEAVPPNKRLRVGIIHVGAPAGGMNAATRQAVRYCLSRGHTPLAIYNGFEGLLEDNIAELSWLRVDPWTTRGGSELGTDRTLPSIGMGEIASALQRHEIDALLLIGGFEAFHSVLMLEKARKDYPSLHIPMITVPATLSNNVPLTDFSLGSDTAINALVAACDAIKQSASASRNRVFVVETQGGMSGYLAVVGALAVGAVLVYTPEDGVSLRMLVDDVEFLRERYALDAKYKAEGRLVIKSEKASSVYTTEVLTKILKEEGKEMFDARSASLGHTLQGGVPSPLDRTRAARLASLAMQFLEKHGRHNSQAHTRRRGDEIRTETAAMIAIRGSKIVYAPMHEVLKYTDMKLRRGIDPWWAGLKQLAEVMGGRAGLLAEQEKKDKEKVTGQRRRSSLSVH